MKILISGAGIAGSAVAFWLTRAGHDVTVVDLSPTLRTGGQAVDFKLPDSSNCRPDGALGGHIRASHFRG